MAVVVNLITIYSVSCPSSGGGGGGICRNWINQGSSVLNVSYTDCSGSNIYGMLLLPGQSICAKETPTYSGGNIGDLQVAGLCTG